MTVATLKQPDYTDPSQSGTGYPLAIDASVSVLKRSAAAFAPHEQSTPNMTARVDAGFIDDSGDVVEVAAQSTGTITAPVGNPRIDRVVIDAIDGSVSVITGTPAGAPVAPAIPVGKRACAQVLLQTSSTAITNSMITDERVLPPLVRQATQLTLNVGGGAGTTVLTAAQWRNDVFVFTGVLTGARVIEVPARAGAPKMYRNDTTGGFTLTVKTNAGTGVAVTQTKRAMLQADGTNVVGAMTDAASLALAASSIIFTPTGGIAAPDVQAAIVELDSEKANKSGGVTFTSGQVNFTCGVTANNGVGVSTGGLGEIMVQNNGVGAALAAFHRSGSFAAYFGLDLDNLWKVGGWSMGAVAYAILHKGRVLFDKGFVSADQTITIAGALTLAHGLGAALVIPPLAFLVCQTSELGYTAGEVLSIPTHGYLASGVSKGVSVKCDATNLYVRYANTGGVNVFDALDNSNGSISGLTNAYWKLRLVAFA